MPMPTVSPPTRISCTSTPAMNGCSGVTEPGSLRAAGVQNTGPPELPGKTAKSSRKVGKDRIGVSGHEAMRPVRRIGNPAPLAE